ncbi:MAG: response regulator transcription factor [Thiovulaceae bacterium]|nr:response regulator transcription factor [Sulfurimonadaceae bacterium]MCW9026929.1 response regulator transcription factor [Sulfurimonadaceae bacterium]
MAKVLLLEDDKILADTLKELLESEEYEVHLAQSSQAALDLSYANSFDIFLFDVNLADFSGFELLKMLRENGYKTPTIFLTSLDDISSLSKGFEVGADDYIKKPFDFDELLIRIQAQLRKVYKSYEDTLEYKNLTYQISSGELLNNDKLVSLTPQEKKLCTMLFQNIDKTLLKEDILYELDIDGESSEGALRVYISKLRKTGLEIQTLKGIGYRLVKA